MLSIMMICLFFAVCDDRQPVSIEKFGSPNLKPFQEDEIASAIVEAYQHPFGGSDIESTSISRDDAIRLAEMIRNSRLDPAPRLEMAEISTFRLISKDGRSQRVCIFWYDAKHPKLFFSLNGVRCVSNNETIDNELRWLDHALMVDGQIRKMAAQFKKDP